MSGIFGILCSSDRATDHRLARELAITLLHPSRIRGREAVARAIHDGEQIHVLEQAGSVRRRSIREYAPRVGFSAEQALQIINAAPKLYW
jgi:glutamine phosphoribosylpyrophosphate amidotransferase